MPPADLFSALASHCDDCFLLESSEGSGKLARFSFLGFSPGKHLLLENGVLKSNGEESDSKNPAQDLKSLIGKTRAASEGFLGGAVGYFSFDYVRYLERLGGGPDDGAGFPDFEFGIFDDVIVYDHRKNTARYLYTTENRLGEINGFLKDSGPEDASIKIKSHSCNTSREEFCENVARAKEYIGAGDIFQVVLSRRHEIGFSGSLPPFYNRLKATNPSPYMYYLKFGERQIIGSSPENLVRVEGRAVTSYATLAGTRPRGRNPDEDKRLEAELLGDEKERAEHLMLVDLTRNDIGKVAKIGTVRVPEFMHVHKYSHVQHIASLVTAELADGRDAFDAFDAIFPAGTVSGAPKLRAIEIIDGLEKARRGPYAGAVGYFSSNGNADFAIGIRTLFANRGNAHVQAGAGIVYDSVPEKEFLETESKARALLDAIGVQGEGA